MKTLRIFAIFLLIIVAYNCISVHAKPGFASKNTKDTLDYKLYIDETKIKPLKDTMFGSPAVKCFIAHCPLKLTNDSNDTLKYLTMSASWWDFYTLDNRNFVFAADYWNVFKNNIDICVLPPHTAVTRDIPIITYKSYFRRQKLRIAMSLKKVEPYLIPVFTADGWRVSKKGTEVHVLPSYQSVNMGVPVIINDDYYGELKFKTAMSLQIAEAYLTPMPTPITTIQIWSNEVAIP